MTGLQRHTRDAPCRICGGHNALERHRGIRCAGFTLTFVTYCTREEYAGALPLDVSVTPPAFKHLLGDGCRCGIRHGERPRGPLVAVLPAKDAYPSIEERNFAYSAALELLSLRDEARSDLTRRGLSEQVIADVGFRSIPMRGTESKAFVLAMVKVVGEPMLLRIPGLHDRNGRATTTTAGPDVDGYLVPFRDEVGRITGWQTKVLGESYKHPFGTRVAHVYAVAGPREPSGDLYITEGGLKAVAAANAGPLWCMGVIGQALQPEHIEVIRRLEPRRVIVALDREANSTTLQARARWLAAIADAGLPTYDAVWEGVT